jgi:hypothetical protein
MIYDQLASRHFIEDVFQHQFPRIIQLILLYSSGLKEDISQISSMIGTINNKMMQFVIGIVINKSEFQNIFNELKK